MTISLLDKKFLFVTGKGGVGKSTIAAGLASVAASLGKRVLICDIDGSHGFARILPSKTLTFDPQLVKKNVWAMAMDTEKSLEEYLRLNLKIPLLGRAKSLAPIFDFVSTAAPGVREILVVGKLAYECEKTTTTS